MVDCTRHDIADRASLLSGMGDTGQYGVVPELQIRVEASGGSWICGVFTATSAYGHRVHLSVLIIGKNSECEALFDRAIYSFSRNVATLYYYPWRWKHITIRITAGSLPGQGTSDERCAVPFSGSCRNSRKREQ